MTDSLPEGYHLVETTDVATQLMNVNYRLDLIITILLFVLGVGAASIIFYLLYRYLLRFM